MKSTAVYRNYRAKRFNTCLTRSSMSNTILTTSQSSWTNLASCTLFIGQNALTDQRTPTKSLTNASNTRSKRTFTTSHTTTARVTNPTRIGNATMRFEWMVGRRSDFLICYTPSRGITLKGCIRSMTRTLSGRWYIDFHQWPGSMHSTEGERVLSFPPNQEKEQICACFEEIREQNSDTQILIVLNNFSSR